MIQANDLSAAAIFTLPIDTEWNDVDGFDVWEACTCNECGAHDVPSAVDSECECGGTFAAGEGPMMNYFYPLPCFDASEGAALSIAHLPLCLVASHEHGAGLALTGGGMDYSWEICEAFALLGFLPPVHFCDLPRMAGRGKSERDVAIVDACRAACRRARSVLGMREDALARLLTD